MIDWFYTNGDLILIIYALMSQQDMTEGRGGMRAVAHFTSEDDAWAVADTKSGIMGRKPETGSWRTVDYRDHNVVPVVVFGSVQEYQDSLNDVAKQKALAKLTHEEQILLGLVK